MKNRCGIIILAAGTSARLGKPKQLLVYKQATLLEHSIHVALQSMADYVIVVLGAHAAAIQPTITNEKLFFVTNEDWQEGMASSIRCGLRYLCALEAVPCALFMACDQPFINASLLDKLVTLQGKKEYAVVASEYAGTAGIPAIFDKKLFPVLLQLKGDAGAKKLIMQQQENMATIPFPLGNIDIDTAADYDRLQKM